MKHSVMNADGSDRKFLTGRAGSPGYRRCNGRRKGVYLSRNNKAGREAGNIVQNSRRLTGCVSKSTDIYLPDMPEAY